MQSFVRYEFKMAAAKNVDDLEYHVTFPAPIPGDDEDSNTTESVLRKKETAVMLIGWLGCEDKYLAKYSRIYENMG